jgi:signal peptidase II
MGVKAFLLQPVQSTKRQHFAWFGAVALVCLGLSQLGSFLINQYLPQGDSVVVLPMLYFTHIRNLGGVFGLAQGHGWLFALFSSALIAALIGYLWRSAQVRTYEFLCFGFVAGGGTSNVLDRIIYGSVIDFINVQGIPYWNYIFNTADTFIHLGLWPMLFIALFLHRD